MDMIEVSAKTVSDAITEACQKLGVTSDKLDYQVVEEGSSGFLGIGAKPAVIKAAVKKSSVEEVARVFLNDVFQAMNMEVAIDIKYNEEDYIRVKVDTEDYRRRRKETLENLAKNIAYKVKRTKRSISLEPMNPYERRIIHSALQNDKYVTTHSEGEEPFRRVVVTLKR